MVTWSWIEVITSMDVENEEFIYFISFKTKNSYLVPHFFYLMKIRIEAYLVMN